MIERHLQGAAAGTAAGWCRIAGLFETTVFEGELMHLLHI